MSFAKRPSFTTIFPDGHVSTIYTTCTGRSRIPDGVCGEFRILFNRLNGVQKFNGFQFRKDAESPFARCDVRPITLTVAITSP
jgi:hypothetical protein